MDTVQTKLKSLASDHGDPPFYMRAEYGVTGLQWKSLGVLFSVHLSIGDLLWAIETGGTLTIGEDGKAIRGSSEVLKEKIDILPPLVPENLEYTSLSQDDKDLDLAIKISETEAKEKPALQNDKDNESSSSSSEVKIKPLKPQRSGSLENFQKAKDISKKESVDKESSISQIIDMGFTRNQAIDALNSADQNVERAINYLLSVSS